MNDEDIRQRKIILLDGVCNLCNRSVIFILRGKFNFPDWNKNPGEWDEMVGAIQEGEMPPIQYRIFHPNSRMNDQQKQELIAALQSSVNSTAFNQRISP